MLNPLAPFTGGNLFLGPQDFVDYMPQLEMDLVPEEGEIGVPTKK